MPVDDEQTTVADLSENDLLARIFPLLPTGPQSLLGPGDDAAVLAAPDGRVVVSLDVLVENRHFRRDWSSAADVGWRAAMQNLADVAAMGARPTALVVGLVLPTDLPVRWVTGFARGMAAACAPSGVAVVGGDALCLSIAAASDLVGAEQVVGNAAPITGSEDFSFMLEAKPGGFIMIGNGFAPDGSFHNVHTPGYDFNDDILTLGAAYWVKLVQTELSVER